MNKAKTPSAPLQGPPVLRQPTEQQRRRWWQPFTTKRFLFFSLALHLLLASGATLLIVQVTSRGPSRHSFAAQPAASTASASTLEHRVQMGKKQSTMSAPPAFKRITTSGAAKVALPAMPALPAARLITPALMPGSGTAPGTGLGLRPSAGGGGGGLGLGGAGAPITSFIGGLRITAQKLGVALDISGSVRDYQQEMHEYVAKTFKGSEVLEFTSAGFYTVASASGSMGSAILEFLNSPQKFDAIYVFSDFGETREGKKEQDLWPTVQRLAKEKKVRLYLHVLRKPGKEGRLNPMLDNVIQFAKSTGGSVKVGEMAHIGATTAGSPDAGR